MWLNEALEATQRARYSIYLALRAGFSCSPAFLPRLVGTDSLRRPSGLGEALHASMYRWV